MLENAAILTLDVLAWLMLPLGIGGFILEILNKGNPIAWLWLIGGILGWALLIIIAAIAHRFLWYTSK